MPEDARILIQENLNAWAVRNLEPTLRRMSADIVYLVNVDRAIAPFAASATGLPAPR